MFSRVFQAFEKNRKRKFCKCQQKIKKITKLFIFLKVYMAQSLLDNKFYAVKAISKNFLKGQKHGIVFLFYLF